MRYFRAKERDYIHDAAYRLYMTKAMQLTVEAVGGVHMTDFSVLIEPKPVDNRSGDEVAADIIARAGLTGGERL